MTTSTSDVAGYSGVTASGSGYTGAAPIVSSGYDGAVRTTASAPYDAVTNYPVTAPPSEVAFTDAEGESFVAPSPQDVNRYTYEWDIGPTSDLVSEGSAMQIMKDSPNVVFPFEVVGRQGERRLLPDSTYDLNNARWPGDDGNPVLVVQADPTSFTFLTLDGHFRGPGHTITFRTREQNGRLILRQEGTSGSTVWDSLYDAGAKLSWQQQASNLRAAIYGGQRAAFP